MLVMLLVSKMGDGGEMGERVGRVRKLCGSKNEEGGCGVGCGESVEILMSTCINELLVG